MKGIVVGGGISGLAAACYLARAGWDMTLLEAGSKLGGRGQSTAFPGGVVNIGPHAIYCGGDGVGVLRELGVVPRGGWAPAHRTLIRDGDDTLGFREIKLSSMWQYMKNTRPPMRRNGVDFAKLDGVRFGEWVTQTFDDEDAERLARASGAIASYCRTDEVSAGAVLRQLSRAFRMVQYTDGGWQSVVDGLEAAARRLGVHIELDSPAYLWGMLYRMTGVRADADDLLQETFVRAIDSPPRDTGRPWRPWLAQVAVNLARDSLRRRRRLTYIGPWLPGPVPTDELPPTPEARYGNRESASMAFLRALEVLTPNQRAVMVLRDVLDHSVKETAKLLGISESNVKVTLHRTRKAMQSYEEKKFAVNPEQVGAVLQEFFSALAAGDSERVLACLADDAIAVSDSGGEFAAARRVVHGAERVRALLGGLAAHLIDEPTFEIVSLNGLPAIDARVNSDIPAAASRVVFGVDVRGNGKIDTVWVLVASGKMPDVAGEKRSRPPDWIRRPADSHLGS